MIIASTKEGGKTAAQTMTRMQDRNSSDKALQQVYKQIVRIAEALHLNGAIVGTAKEFYKEVYEAKGARGRGLAAVAAAVVFEACRNEGLPRTFKVHP